MTAPVRATSRLRIVVLGYVVRGPLGGLAWHYLQYVMGLASLGHDVYYVEESDDFHSCYDPVTDARGTDPTYGLAFAERAFARIGLGERWAYHDAHTGRWRGPLAGRVGAVLRTADLCLNVSGVNRLRRWLLDVPVRVLIDTDPAFTQIRHLTDPAALRHAKQHTNFLTFAENLPAGRADVPDDGLPWRPTRQPAVLEAWPVTPGPAAGRFTSVLLWQSYAAAHYGGRKYGHKADAFEPYLSMPGRAGRVFELALGSASAPGAYLQSLGWSVIDPREPTADPWKYQAYIAASKAEFGVAKAAYVMTRSGWFSERSAAYLASGRPAIVQDTGFTDWLRGGDGVLPFTNPEEAVTAVAEVSARYQHHCRAAREIAESSFDARRVLTRLIESVMTTQTPPPRVGCAG